MSRHRLESVRPRYGRIAALGVSLVVTLVAILGGTGLIPTTFMGDTATADPRARLQVLDPAASSAPASPVTTVAPEPTKRAAPRVVLDPPVTTAPARSGSGRRVVFSQDDQRVWLINGKDKVLRTYLVSGSVTDNLDKGSYRVFSRSENATGIDDSGTMKWFVRFAHGPRAAIGFHDIPVHKGKPVQTKKQLGTPLSHGCIRQTSGDAQQLWKFAPIGTRVVVI